MGKVTGQKRPSQRHTAMWVSASPDPHTCGGDALYHNTVWIQARGFAEASSAIPWLYDQAA